MNIKQVLKQNSVQILLLAGILKLSIFLFFGLSSFDLDFIISTFLFLIILSLFGYTILKKRITLIRLFIAAYFSMLLYNFSIGAFGLVQPMDKIALLTSGIDLGIIAVIIGYFKGVKK